MATIQNHTYNQRVISGVTLHIIETKASNIQLRNLKKSNSLISSNYYGINGGWFNIIPLQDIMPLNITYDSRAGGRIQPSNNGNGGGAISWINNTLNYHWGVNSVTQITNYSNSTWIQGGFSMHLGNPQWYSLCWNECGWEPDYMKDSDRNARAAMVIQKSTQKVYLIVTRNTVNWSLFRNCIQIYFNIKTGTENTDYQGIFLDGSGSAQLKAKTSNSTVSVYDPFDKRAICGAITLINTN